jgi:flagellar biosynthetic protein FlhB
MAEEHDGERTEPASPRKREESRKKGMLAQSQDLGQVCVLCAGLVAISYFGPGLINALNESMRGCLGNLHTADGPVSWLSQTGAALVLNVGWALLLICVCAAAAGMGIGMLQSGLYFNIELLSFKWERVDPVKGIQRLFSLTSAVSALLGICKVAVVVFASYGAVVEVMRSSNLLWQQTPRELLLVILHGGVSLGWTIAIPLFCLAAADYGYKKWKYEKDLMMTKEEVKQEGKQQEGDPHIKQRIRQIQRQRAMQRMMQDVPKATVVVTNPTHVAVALRYEAGVTAAPVVIAKGEHLVAQRIKAIAHANGIPVYEEPPLARAMLRAIPIGAPVTMEFYRAVAEILAVLYRARNNAIHPALRRTA